MTDISSLEVIIQGFQHKDPYLYNALAAIIRNLRDLSAQVEPLLIQSEIEETIAATIEPPTNFSFMFFATFIRFSWDIVPGAAQYEIRHTTVLPVGDGGWNTADFQTRTSAIQAVILPITVGTHYYLIKSIAAGGSLSLGYTTCVVTVPALGSFSLSAQVIDNTVLLIWNAPASTFSIHHYTIYRSGNPIGTISGTFTALFEMVAGTYTYSVVATDIAGNNSASVSIDATVSQPPDFILVSSQLSDLDGTRTNVLLVAGPKLLCCWTAESWQSHFTSRAWSDPQDQIDAGYPIYIQPTHTSGKYVEVFDFGAILDRVIVSVDYLFNQLTPEAVVTQLTLEVSDNNINWSTPVISSSMYAASLRYVRVTLDFTATDKALMELWNLRCWLDVKQDLDSGTVEALSTDVTGTVVTLNKVFKDIDSITATAESTLEPFTVIVDFTDIPDPTTFKVFLFDTSGNRKTGYVDWKARGIV